MSDEATTSFPKTILVTGDWVADWSLARPKNLPEGYFDGSEQSQLHLRAGGAWYVAHLITMVACRDLCGRLNVQAVRPSAECAAGLKADGTQRADIAHAYSVWWKHKRLESGKHDDKVWRIARFAGCQKSSEWNPPTISDRKANLLVIDDLGLGFSDHLDALAHVQAHLADDGKVLLKHGVRPDGGGMLPKLLKAGLESRVSVLVSANALRRRNAALSRGLSWDRSLEDIENDFRSGPSKHDLAKCELVVVHFGLVGAAVFKKGELYRQYFLPDEMEHAWEDERQGSSFGTGSVLAACLSRHLVAPETYPIFFALCQGLSAQRTAHEVGGGKEDILAIDLPFGSRNTVADTELNLAAACIAPPLASDPPGAKHLAAVAPFRAAWDSDHPKVWDEASAGLKGSRLLTNVTGTTPGSLLAKAIEVVISGREAALAAVPRAAYGKFFSVDRQEIESINEIRRLVQEYRRSEEDKRPLSIAVFGAPGSGKSFAIKQLAKALFGRDKEPLEFNLTQIKEPEDLHQAFHQVRDASVRGEIPLVFWDEFDTSGLNWLADFLAPMQDAEFFDGSHKHPFGKCIFVFAGGTCTRFDEFKKWAKLQEGKNWAPTREDPWHQTFKALKGPDFISRLRGYLNVKGPNPTTNEADDPAYVLRRALLLRSEIDKSFPLLVSSEHNKANIAPNLLHALLTVTRYEHGARSLISLLSMSTLTQARSFNVSALPACDLLALHISDDFAAKLNAPSTAAVASPALFEVLARAGFEGWKTAKQQQGYVHGPRNEKATPPTHHLIKPWEDLNPEEKPGNYSPIPRRLVALQQIGWNLAAGPGKPLTTEEREEIVSKLPQMEHHIWLADHLVTGWECADCTRDHLRQHTDVKPFSELPTQQQDINRLIAEATINAVEQAGYCLRKST